MSVVLIKSSIWGWGGGTTSDSKFNPGSHVVSSLLISLVFVAQSCLDSLRPHGLWPIRLLCQWNSPGKNTGVGCHSLLQGIFPTQGSNLSLLHCRQSLYHRSQQGSPVSFNFGDLTWRFFAFHDRDSLGTASCLVDVPCCICRLLPRD